MRLAEGEELLVQWALQVVWLIRKWQGAFRGLTLNTGTCVLCTLPIDRARALTVVCGLCCTNVQPLCEASVGTSRRCSTREVGHPSAIPCVQKQTCSKSLPEAPAGKKKKTDCVPLSPFPLRHLHDCIDLSWFHSTRPPAGFQVSNICHTAAPSCRLIQNTRKRANFSRNRFHFSC